MRNDTNNIYQIVIDFDDDYMYAKILSDNNLNKKISIINDNFKYIKKNNKIYESVEVIKIIKDKKSNKEIKRQKLYDEVIEVGYELPKDVKVEEM